MRNGTQDDIQISLLKFYRDKDLKIKAFMSHLLTLETSITVARLLLLEEKTDGIFVRLRGKGCLPRKTLLS